MAHGKQIRLFLTDSSASGIRYAELVNWTGQAFSCPKSLLPNLREWPETQRPGVYVLIGLNAAGDDAVYIGESENVSNRLLWHLRNSTLDDIVEAFFFTSKDDNLTKGHITFLEQRLVRRAVDAKRYAVEFGREPGAKTLSKPEAATMEEFLENLYLVAAATGYDVFEKLTAKEDAPTDGYFMLNLENGVSATGFPTEEGFLVTKGSHARATETGSLQAGYKAVRAELRTKGVLVVDGDRLRFNDNYTFQSSSAAAGVVAGSQRSGPQSWIRGDGKSLRDVEAETAESEEQVISSASQPEVACGVQNA